ncbi:hypothetical protein GGF32_004660 [Allomyces javanicus]|nr:hypothetical protein GGF32_004660 [Allomyces javanicus]
MLLLAQYPEIRQELLDEVVTVDLDNDGAPSKLPRLNAIIKRCLFVAGIVKRYVLTTKVPIGGEELHCAVTLRMTNAWVRFTRRNG